MRAAPPAAGQAGLPGKAGRPAVLGFTLVEACVTLAVLVVLGAIAAPSFSAQVARQRLQAAARHLQADIALARLEADKRGTTMTLAFQPGQDWCYSLGWGAPADCRGLSSPLPHGVLRLVRAADNPGVRLLDASTVLLKPRGGSAAQGSAGLTGGQARFASLANPAQVLLVRVGPHGRASVCAAGAAIGGTAACAVAAAGL